MQGLRVLHSAPVWLPQTQTWMHAQAACLPDWIECHVVCDTTANLEQFDIPNIHALNASPVYRMWDKLCRHLHLREHFGHLPGVARSADADLLHSHFGHIGWTNHKIAASMGLPHVVTFYGQDVTFLPKKDPRWIDRYGDMFEGAAAVLCEGAHMAKRVVALGCPEQKVHVHHLGVNVQGYRFEPRVWDSTQPLRVLLAGAFTEKKGFVDAIEALALVQDEVKLEVTILGDAAPGNARHAAEKARILAALEQTGLITRTKALGFQPHTTLLEEAYRHHLFLSPSVHASDGDSEGGAPVTILEMAATGMPVISTQHCDIPEVIRDEIGGLLADEHDVHGIAANLRRLIDDPGCWEAMAKVARHHIETNYDQALQGQALAKIYASVAQAAQ